MCIWHHKLCNAQKGVGPNFTWSNEQNEFMNRKLCHNLQFVTRTENVKKKNPAYGRHQHSRPMGIVGPIQFWRGCVIYLLKKKLNKNYLPPLPRQGAFRGGGPSGTHHRFQESTQDHRSAPKKRTRSTQKFGLGPLRNTSQFLGLYLRPPIRTEKRTRSTRK